ncbi:MAG: nickel/cobalt efflux transporter [Stappiaceae bacterium]
MDILSLVETGSTSPVMLIFIALAIGALHGLEPGHSKTMMAAFIIAVRGTPWQAILLGLSATFSHTLIVWVLALLALTYGSQFIAEDLEPWLIVISGGIIMLVAFWIFLQTRQAAKARTQSHEHGHTHVHEHQHRHGHGHSSDHAHHHHPHGHYDHDHLSGDAHARAHAQEINTRFSSGKATNTQTILFGLTGGLIPCPAAITVLLLCLNLQKFWLGVTLVSAFSIGLALTLVTAGVVAAVGLSYARKKTDKVDAFLLKAPYFSAALIALIGFYMLWSGWVHLVEHG